MQLLTPQGNQDVESITPGAMVVGNRGLNRVLSVERVDSAEWERWHQTVRCPNWLDYDINGGDIQLFGEQSIFHNDGKVTHARLLRPGNIVFRDGKPVRVKRVRQIDAKPWHRLEIDGDHTYIGDGLSLHNASRFCKPGAGSQDWTPSNTGLWAATSAGATGASVPGSADSVTCDGNFGGGTCNVNFGGTITITSLTCGAMIGTLDNSTNNNPFTISTNTGFSLTGSAARTIKLGSATYTLNSTASATLWNATTTTNLTFVAGTSTIAFTGNSTAQSTFAGGGLTYSAVTFSAITAAGFRSMSGANTYTSITVTGPCPIRFPASVTQTITTLTLTGTSGNEVYVFSDSIGTQATLAITTLVTAWCAIRDISSSGTFSNSFDLGNNSGSVIMAPSTSLGIPKMGMAKV